MQATVYIYSQPRKKSTYEPGQEEAVPRTSHHKPELEAQAWA